MKEDDLSFTPGFNRVTKLLYNRTNRFNGFPLLLKSRNQDI